MTQKQCTCPSLDRDGAIIYRKDFRVSLIGAPKGPWLPRRVSSRQENGRLRHPKHLVCAEHAVTYDVARVILRYFSDHSLQQNLIENCIALAIAQPSVGTVNGPFVPVLSIAARQTALGGQTFGPASRGATYVVRALCLALVDLPFGDYLLAHLLSFVIGSKATQALSSVTTTGVRFTDKTKAKVLARQHDKTSLESLVIAVRRSVAHIRAQRPPPTKRKLVCRQCGSHDIEECI